MEIYLVGGAVRDEKLLDLKDIDTKYKAPHYNNYTQMMFKQIMSVQQTLYTDKEINEILTKLAYYRYYEKHCDTSAANNKTL